MVDDKRNGQEDEGKLNDGVKDRVARGVKPHELKLGLSLFVARIELLFKLVASPLQDRADAQPDKRGNGQSDDDGDSEHPHKIQAWKTKHKIKIRPRAPRYKPLGIENPSGMALSEPPQVGGDEAQAGQ